LARSSDRSPPIAAFESGDRVGRDQPPGQFAVDFRSRHVAAQPRQRELVAAQGEVGG
jgi:hypothetical protein